MSLPTTAPKLLSWDIGSAAPGPSASLPSLEWHLSLFHTSPPASQTSSPFSPVSPAPVSRLPTLSPPPGLVHLEGSPCPSHSIPDMVVSSLARQVPALRKTCRERQHGVEWISVSSGQTHMFPSSSGPKQTTSPSTSSPDVKQPPLPGDCLCVPARVTRELCCCSSCARCFAPLPLLSPWQGLPRISLHVSLRANGIKWTAPLPALSARSITQEK